MMGFSDGGGIGWTICTSLKTDNYTKTSSLFFRGRMLFLTPTVSEH